MSCRPKGLAGNEPTGALACPSHSLPQRRQLAERGARIVVVSSAAHKGMPVRLDDLQWRTREHNAGRAYAESKSANILFAQEATRRLSAEGVLTPEQAVLMAPERPAEELYDLEKDPHEMNNLAGNPRYTSTLEDLREELSQWRLSQNDFEKEYK